jgi:hypothetical protein
MVTDNEFDVEDCLALSAISIMHIQLSIQAFNFNNNRLAFIGKPFERPVFTGPIGRIRHALRDAPQISENVETNYVWPHIFATDLHKWLFQETFVATVPMM